MGAKRRSEKPLQSLRVGDDAPKETSKTPSISPPLTATNYTPTVRSMESTPPSASSTAGETLIQDLNDPHRKRGTYRLLQRAIDIALDIPYDAMRLACMTAVRDLQSPEDRIRSRAREFLFKVQDSGVGAVVGLDRISRLDEGTATENITIAAITPEAIEAVVRTLRTSTDGLGER